MPMLLVFCTLVLILQVTNGQKYRVWGQEGTGVMLPCHLSPQKLKDNLGQLYKGLMVDWVRHGGSSSTKRHLVLKVKPSGLKSLGHSVMHRVTVWDTGFLKGNFSLQIEPLLKEDAGIYEARVRHGSEEWHCQLDLGVVSVIAHPSHPLIESEFIRLSCNSTHPGNPTNTRWFHRGVLIHPSYRIRPMGQSLLISESVSRDSGPWLCELTFADGERIAATYNLQVIGFAEQAPSVIYTAVGYDAQLPCVLNSNPMDYGISRLVVQWSSMAGRELMTKPIPSYENHQDFTLHLPGVGLDDAGHYLCQVTIQGITITENVTLVVMTVIPSTVEPRIAEGSHLLLICNLSYNEGKEHFQWKWLDMESTNSPQSESVSIRPEILKWGPILEFPKVSPRDAGIWECSAHGPDGKLGSVQYHLEISASAQLASLPLMSTEITFGLFLLVLFSIIALIYLRRRMHSLNFQALDMIVDSLPGKGEKNGGQQKTALEC